MTEYFEIHELLDTWQVNYMRTHSFIPLKAAFVFKSQDRLTKEKLRKVNKS